MTAETPTARYAVGSQRMSYKRDGLHGYRHVVVDNERAVCVCKCTDADQAERVAAALNAGRSLDDVIRAERTLRARTVP